MDSEVFLLILLTPFVLGGVWLLVYGLRQRQRASAAEQWPAVEGRLLSADVGRHSSRSKYGLNVWYVPEIEYEYSVGGVRFTSRRISFGSPSFNTREGAESVLRQFGTVGAVPVHYDPNKPKDAVLAAGKAPRSLGFTLAGAAMIAFPILLAVYLLALS